MDVIVEDFPHFKVDAKYRTRHAHHSLLDEVRRKYCKSPTDVPILVTKSHHQNGANVTLPLEVFAVILNRARQTNVAELKFANIADRIQDGGEPFFHPDDDRG